MSKKKSAKNVTSEATENSKLQAVAKQIEELLLANEMAIQPFMNRTAYGTFASARIVSTKEALQDKTAENVEQGKDKVEAKGA